MANDASTSTLDEKLAAVETPKPATGEVSAAANKPANDDTVKDMSEASFTWQDSSGPKIGNSSTKLYVGGAIIGAILFIFGMSYVLAGI